MGYIGYSRSVNAAEAMEEFRFPLSQFNRNNIDEFLDEFELVEETPEIKKISVKKWAYIAKNIVKTFEWHHTSKYYNCTDFYSLSDVYDYIRDHIEEVKALNIEPQKAQDFEYAFCKIPTWGGSLRSPKLLGFYKREGVIIGQWFYFNDTDGYDRPCISKKKLTANAFEVLISNSEFNSYKKEFIKTQKTKSDGKRALDKIAKLKIKTK